MKEIRKILQTISSTASLKEKERLLKEEKDNDILFKLLLLHSSPFEQFYVSKMVETRPFANSFKLHGATNYEKFLYLTANLRERVLSGHDALATIYDFFEQCDKDEYWVFRTILLKEPLNFGASLINKVRPDWVPEFKLMLADSTMAKLDEINYPVIAQTKLDGFRAVYFPDQKMFIGRNGRPIRNQNLQTYFAKLSKNDAYVLDGELYSDVLNFNQIASVLNSEGKPLDGIYYCVYDAIYKDQWAKQECTISYNERWKVLNGMISEWKLSNVKQVTGFLAKNKHEVKDFYGLMLDKGYEGLMLKSTSGLYQWKRVSISSQIMSKMKPKDSYDGEIVGYEEGTGKFENQLGVFIVKVEGIKNLVKVGSGFTEKQRQEYWGKRAKLVGEWITLEAFEITEGNESLRFPIFNSIRDSKK